MFTPSPQTRCASARSLFIYSCFRALASAMALLLHLRPRKPISRALRMEKPTSSWVRYSGFLRDLVAASVWPSFKVSPNKIRAVRFSQRTALIFLLKGSDNLTRRIRLVGLFLIRVVRLPKRGKRCGNAFRWLLVRLKRSATLPRVFETL